MRRFALFVIVLAVVAGIGSQPWNGGWRGLTACFRAHAKTSGSPVYGAAMGSTDGWAIHDCSGEDTDHTNWGWGRHERACEMRTITIPAPSKLDVSSMNGGIRILGEDRKDVQIDARVQAWGDSAAEASSILREVQIQAAGTELPLGQPWIRDQLYDPCSSPAFRRVEDHERRYRAGASGWQPEI
jgi:hypothetical protein